MEYFGPWGIWKYGQYLVIFSIEAKTKEKTENYKHLSCIRYPDTATIIISFNLDVSLSTSKKSIPV